MKKRVLLFLVLTAANVLVYIFRDAFQYVPYATYSDLYAPCDSPACREKWNDFLLPYSPASLTEAARLLPPAADTGSTLSRIRHIGTHLYAKFHRQAGFPQDVIHRADPVDQYKILAADTAQKLWCGTWAQLMNFFCWSQNIITRSVEIYKPGDHHVFNECYVPERRQWVMVDLTHNLLWTEKAGRLLNVQDFLQGAPAPDSVTVWPCDAQPPRPLSAFAQRSSIAAYYNPAFPFYYYRMTHAREIYRAGEKWKRYVWPTGWYHVYAPRKKANILFYTKLVLLAGWLILAGTIVFKRFT